MNLFKTLILILILHVTADAKLINIDNIVNQANKQDKKVLIFFHMTYCGACKKMIRTSIENPQVMQQIKRDFIFVDLNINNDDNIIYKDFKGSAHKFAKTLGIYFYPSSIFIDRDNEVIYNLKGYRDRDKFLTVIEYISTSSYKKMSLESFIDEKEFNKD